MTSLLEILDPTYVTVELQGSLEVEPYYFQSQVKKDVEQALLDLLSFDEVDFEDTLYLSKIYEAVEAVEGVLSVNIESFAKSPDTESVPGDGKLTFEWDQIPRFDGVTWSSVTGGLGA